MKGNVLRMTLLVTGILVTLTVLTVLLAAHDSTQSRASYSWSQPPPHASAGEAVDALPKLVVAPQSPTGGYRPGAFPMWSQIIGSPCDVREVALLRAGSGVTTDRDCRVLSGQWESFGDGHLLTRPQDVVVEHLVPLENAWRSGASTWGPERRTLFANDLDSPELRVVAAEVAETKGDAGPDQWRPAEEKAWCQYAADWVAVKARYELTVTEAEKAALADMLKPCQE